jgi:hypothetical protein
LVEPDVSAAGPTVLSGPQHADRSAAAPAIDPHPAKPTAPSPAADASADAHADAAYRDVLIRVREEREQLGQLISHPF